MKLYINCICMKLFDAMLKLFGVMQPSFTKE
jgi:hypothetical protein